MYPEFHRAEYQQKRKSRMQRMGKAGAVFFIAVLATVCSALFYVTFIR